jgi:hypothetical protein
MEKMAEDTVSDEGIKIKEQSQKSMAARSVRSNHYTHRILARQSKQTGRPQCIYKECTDKTNHISENQLRNLLHCTSSSAA